MSNKRNFSVIQILNISNSKLIMQKGKGIIKMKIIDFMICTGNLSNINYVLVEDTVENISKLKEMGCTDSEIATMKSEEDNYLDVYPVLNKKDYSFSPQKGFYKAQKGEGK